MSYFLKRQCIWLDSAFYRASRADVIERPMLAGRFISTDASVSDLISDDLNAVLTSDAVTYLTSSLNSTRYSVHWVFKYMLALLARIFAAFFGIINLWFQVHYVQAYRGVSLCSQCSESYSFAPAIQHRPVCLQCAAVSPITPNCWHCIYQRCWGPYGTPDMTCSNVLKISCLCESHCFVIACISEAVSQSSRLLLATSSSRSSLRACAYWANYIFEEFYVDLLVVDEHFNDSYILQGEAAGLDKKRLLFP